MTRPGSAAVSESVLGNLVSVLDLVVMERLPGGAMYQLGDQPPPSWFAEHFRNEDPRQPVTLAQAFPVLDSFLSEAEVFWGGKADGRLEGEPLVVTGAGSETIAIATIAVTMSGRHFLVLQRVTGFDDRQQILQRARERALEHEQVVKRIDALRTPLKTLERLATELHGTRLDELQKERADAITSQLASLRSMLEELPAMPRAASARRR